MLLFYNLIQIWKIPCFNSQLDDGIGKDRKWLINEYNLMNKDVEINIIEMLVVINRGFTRSYFLTILEVEIRLLFYPKTFLLQMFSKKNFTLKYDVFFSLNY